MEDNNLKECWKEIHTGTEIKANEYKRSDTQEALSYHSQTLRRQKTLISLFAILLAFSVAASIWGYDQSWEAPRSPYGPEVPFCCFCWFRPLDIISSSQGRQTHIH